MYAYGTARGREGGSRVFAIANQKGGVGKTTTAVNLGAGLALLGHRVLVVDFDPQANATSGLGAARERLSRGVYEVLMGEVEAEEAVLKTKISNLFLLPALPDLAGAEIELVSLPRREARLKEALEGVRRQYDFVLIDCPPSLGLLTLNALVAADGVIVPIQCEYYALEGLSRLLSTVKAVKANWNPSLEIAGVVLTMFDGRTNLSIQVAEEVKKFFRDKVFRSIIPRNVRLSEAPSHGLPGVLYDSRSRGAECYLELAKEVSELFGRQARVGTRA